MKETIMYLLLLPIVLLIKAGPMLIPLGIVGAILYYNHKEAGKNALKVVTHYCPNCGLLVSDKENQIHYCVLCGTAMKEGREKDKVSLNGPYWDREAEHNNKLIWAYWCLDADFNAGKVESIFDYVKRHPDNIVAQHYEAMCYDKTDSRRIDKLMLLSEQGHGKSAWELGCDYWVADGGMEKNNVLAQKYMERAAQLDYAPAYGVIADLCMNGEFRWSNIVKSFEDGYFKGAIRGATFPMSVICEKYNGQRTAAISSRVKDRLPSSDECKLWWMVYAARMGSAEAVPHIRVCCTRLMKALSVYKRNPEASALYAEYEQIMKYWNEKELELQYPNPTCYEAVIAEQNNEIEKALDLYIRAAEEDNDKKAIEAVRRLTGNKNYKLKTGRLQSEDYRPIYNKAQSLLQSGEYDLCLIQSRKALEIYVHNLFFEKKVDMPEKDDLHDLIKKLYEMQLVDEKTYKAMDFVRRKGNSAAHGTEKVDVETANRVVDALTQIIPNRQ